MAFYKQILCHTKYINHLPFRKKSQWSVLCVNLFLNLYWWQVKQFNLENIWRIVIQLLRKLLSNTNNKQGV